MKTFRNLYPKVYSFENLYRSFRKARKGGKRKKQEVAAFEYHLEKELWRLHHELKTKTYVPGPYHNFYIYERKKRKISAAPFRDRIVHHVIYNVMEPIFELAPSPLTPRSSAERDVRRVPPLPSPNLGGGERGPGGEG